MKLQDYRETFYTFSGKASDLNRQLAFAGIAIIWLFKKEPLAGLTVPKELVLPGLLIVASLIADMLQYCIASVLWRVFYRSKENLNVSEDKDIKHGVWWERPIWIAFWLKIALIITAYIFLMRFLWSAISFR
ncbi:hypothetical protein [Bradyrhizobium sp. CB3481]|uniref:hypothetical protein n=1 Tax=Bradyrhizobium sp. CB3481 TaxID=3039158 RepID=UPI0024B1E3BC|nr:hypothetical protein [Bradyrhizobium sp. CB3481]WFU14415.1 hypothetical protein QA643_24875 [Bradyrhizobium sp. CB3481]